MKKLYVLAIMATLLLAAGCMTKLPVAQNNAFYSYAQQVFDSENNFTFYSMPSFGRARDTVFMKQNAALGIPTHAAQTILQHLQASEQREVRLAITGASSARSAHIVREAFGLLPDRRRTSGLQLLFIGRPEFEQDLRKLTEDRGGRFFFKEFDPGT